MRPNDVILQTCTNAVAFIILIFSLYLFFAGHDQPGGGFIGGLMTTAALVLFHVAYDMRTFKRMVSIDFKTMVGCGLLIAVLTAAGSIFFQIPFLTHGASDFTIPLFGNIELSTTLVFDLGVYLTVVGGTMTIMQTIAGDDK